MDLLILPTELLAVIAAADSIAAWRLWPSLTAESRRDVAAIIAGEKLRYSRCEFTAPWIATSWCHGRLHSFDDVPAVRTELVSAWFDHGELHRDGDFALIYTDVHVTAYDNGHWFSRLGWPGPDEGVAGIAFNRGKAIGLMRADSKLRYDRRFFIQDRIRWTCDDLMSRKFEFMIIY